MTVINLATLPEYYYLYALYFDYQLNNRTHLNEEEARRVEDILRRVHPLGRRGAPFRKSWALRLFTERDDLTRFSPHQLKEAWHQLHRLLEQWRLTRGWDRPTADRLGIVRRADTYP
ncbi:MAG: hypothetical protein OEW12_08315, partial [Deltaproteobacteria bacterium]|nr:hypothetical protein [Deltaproteobacteria bacterium]